MKTDTFTHRFYINRGFIIIFCAITLGIGGARVALAKDQDGNYPYSIIETIKSQFSIDDTNKAETESTEIYRTLNFTWCSVNDNRLNGIKSLVEKHCNHHGGEYKNNWCGEAGSRNPVYKVDAVQLPSTTQSEICKPNELEFSISFFEQGKALNKKRWIAFAYMNLKYMRD